MIGIYKITDKVSKKSYIGQSKNILHRWKEHIKNIREGEGINHNGINLKLEDLTFEILELCSCEELDEKEIYWIKHYDTYYSGFNKTLGGQHIKGKEKERKPSTVKGDIYFTDLKEYINQLTPIFERGYWCFSPWVKENKTIVELANSLGFNAIELHSMNNKEEPMNEEQKRVANIIITTGMVPIEYDFVIVNKAFERGYNIRDQRFNQIIVNSIDKAEREQACRMAYPYTRALKTFAPPVPDEFLEKWIPVEQCRTLAEILAVPETDKNNSGKKMTWNRLKDYLPVMGYFVETKKKRVNGKLQQCYFIKGEWKDAEIEDGNFMALVKAKS